MFVILLPVYYFPRAVWRTKLDPLVKVSIIGAAWGGLILVGTITSAHQASVANAKGCITIAGAPNDYYDPSDGKQQLPPGLRTRPDLADLRVVTGAADGVRRPNRQGPVR